MLSKLQTQKEEREQGFTLIELLVVILIIGILSAIAIPAYLNQRKAAIDLTVESDVRNISITVETLVMKATGDFRQVKNADIEKDLSTNEGNLWEYAPSTNGQTYCVTAWNENSETYTSKAKGLTYDSTKGVASTSGGAC